MVSFPMEKYIDVVGLLLLYRGNGATFALTRVSYESFACQAMSAVFDSRTALRIPV